MGCCAAKQTKQRRNNRPEANNATKEKGHSPHKKLTMSEVELKQQIQLTFNRYDSNGDGTLEFDQVQRMFDEAKRRDKSHEVSSESRVEDYVNMYMLSADYKQDGRVNKQQLYRYYKLRS